MTIAEMIEALESLQDDMGEDAEVLMAQQPSWPFEYSIKGITEYNGKVYVVEGQQLAYASNEIWNKVY